MKKLLPQEALARIMEKMPRKAPKMGGGQTESLSFFTSYGDASDTVYEFKMGTGHVLAPAFDNLPPIIATFEVEEGSELPVEVEEWFIDYARELEQLENGTATMIEDDEAEASGIGEEKVINPLVSCNWNQRAPYNDRIIDGCATGCGATALSMLLKYWGDRGFALGLPATKSYTTKTDKRIVPALKSVLSFDYKHMPNGKPKTAQEIAAVATIMQHVGYAITSDYKTTGTSSSLTNIVNLLKTTLHMNEAKTVYASNGAKIFETNIKNELVEGRPVFIGGWNSGGTGGHWFILDGYDPATNFFHVNWGAGGSYNGWFALTALNPGKYNYSSYKKAIVGIQPGYIKGDANGDGTVSVSDVMKVQSMILNHEYSNAADVNNDGEVTVTDLMSIVRYILEGGTL